MALGCHENVIAPVGLARPGAYADLSVGHDGLDRSGNIDEMVHIIIGGRKGRRLAGVGFVADFPVAEAVSVRFTVRNCRRPLGRGECKIGTGGFEFEYGPLLWHLEKVHQLGYLVDRADYSRRFRADVIESCHWIFKLAQRFFQRCLGSGELIGHVRVVGVSAPAADGMERYAGSFLRCRANGSCGIDVDDK